MIPHNQKYDIGISPEYRSCSAPGVVAAFVVSIPHRGICVALVGILRNYISTTFHHHILTDQSMRNKVTFMYPLQATYLT
jgi:hypothetical protein